MVEANDISQTNLRVTRDRKGPRFQFGSSRGFEWTRLERPVAGLPPALHGLRILHLADFHCRRSWDSAYDELLSRVKSNPPDLILFSGDFVESKRDARPAMPTVQKLMSSLTSRLGTFAILGNHDGDLVGPPLLGCNLTMIQNQRVYLDAGHCGVELIGLAGVDRLDINLPWALSLGKKLPDSVRIILSHYPDILPKVKSLEPDLYLCGHTHGGQVAWPSGLPIFRHDSLPHRLCSGIHRAFGTVMVVNRGFGFSSPLKLRMFCPAEVVEVVLCADDATPTNPPAV